MSKKEFLARLEKRFAVLKPEEREDILQEYAQHIEVKMQGGMSEEEAVRDFGDVDELADGILEAYNVNPDYDKKQKNKIDMDKVSSSFSQGWGKAKNGARHLWSSVDEAAGGLMRQSPTDLLFTAVLAGVLVVILVIIGWFGAGLLELLIRLMSGWMPEVLARVLGKFVQFCAGCLYFLVSAAIIYGFISRRLGKGAAKRDANGQESVQQSPFQTEQPSGREVSDFVMDEQAYQGAANSRQSAPQSEQPGRSPSGGGLADILTLLIKIVIVICLLPMVPVALGVIVGFGVMVALMVQGFPVIGITMILFGMMLCCITFLTAVVSWIFKRGGKKE